MKYELGDIFKLEENNYMVAETIIYNDIEYLLLNKLDEQEDPSQELYIYKVTENGLMKITEKEILDLILPVFNNKIQKQIIDELKKEKYNI